MKKNIGKLVLVFAILFSITFALANVTLEEGTEIELVDVNNSSIYLGHNYTFTENVTVYGDAVEFQNNSVSNNLSVYGNTSQEINSTLETYWLNNPANYTNQEVFKINTEANGPVEVTYEVDAKQVPSGQYVIKDNDSNQIDTFDGSTTAQWSETSWSNNTFTIEYTGREVYMNWTRNSDNEDGFGIYSNSTSDVDDPTGENISTAQPHYEYEDYTVKTVNNKEVVEANITEGDMDTKDKTAEWSDGDYICFAVNAYNGYGPSELVGGTASEYCTTIGS